MACDYCKVQKPQSEFYIHKLLPDSPHYKNCKKCHKEIGRLNKLKNYDPIKERVKSQKRITSGKSKESARRMYLKYPEKCKARAKFKHEIKMGRLKRLPCEVCKETEAHGHHPDYKKPLEVIWLCKKHHSFLHRKKPLLKDYNLNK